MFERFLMAFAPDNGAGQASDSGNAAAGQNSGGTGSQNNQQVQQGSGTQTNQANAGQNNQTVQVDQVAMPRDAFNQRLEQERNAGVRNLLKAFGFEVETPEAFAQAQTDLKDLLDFARQQKEATLSAEQRSAQQLEAANNRAVKAEGQVTTLTAERDQARSELRSYVLRTQIMAAATGAVYPHDVYTWAIQHAKTDVDAILKADQALFGPDGTLNDSAIDGEQVKKVVSACAQARPTWFRNPGHGGSPSNGGAQPPRQAPGGRAAEDRKQAAARKTARI